jgi:diguanylate cyclase (GGDEF)-like protein
VVVLPGVGGHRSPGVPAFTHEWVRALDRTCYLTWSSDDTATALAPLVEALSESLSRDPFVPESAREIGIRLAGIGPRGRTTLQTTMRLIRTRAPELFTVCRAAGGDRIDDVLFELAAGYADGLVERAQLERAQAEREELLAAVLAARKDIEAVLRASAERTRLLHQTYHDQLTGLPNRSLMREQLRWAFSPESSVRRVGLCHLDLDGFRAINDTLGHQVGDQLLLAVAARLRLLAEGYLVTRVGAGEFAILVPDPASEHDLVVLAEHVRGGLGPPFVIGHHRMSISASLGLACSAVADTSPAELQRCADAARSWAKSAGGGRWAMFDPKRDADETVRFALATSIPAAVDREEFRLHYQPLVRMGSGELIGAEALVRWRHPEYGLLSPAEFIELAEGNGSIVSLGRWVLTEACRQARAWVDQLGTAAPYVSVNVAPRQLAEPGWLDEVSGVLELTGLDPELLQLEITERAVLVDESAASDTLRALREMGVRLAIDDFGTGYSSLSYLRRLPVHGLKIDGSFIRGLRAASAEDSKENKIIEALITMSHALGLEVTAEWVETASQAHRLAALGCDIGQGNWYGHPVCAGQLAPLLHGPLAG